MEIFKSIIELIQVIAWPLLTLIIFLSLSKPISNLIERLKKAGSKNIELEFSLDKQTIIDTSNIISSLTKEKSDIYLQKIISEFESETLTFYDEIIENEIEISKVIESSEKSKLLYNYSRILLIILNFNKIHSLIFGSQIKILQELEINGVQSKASLKKHYECSATVNKDVFNNYDFNRYLYFLESNKLISLVDNNQIMLSKMGSDFLKYLYNSGLEINKPL